MGIRWKSFEMPKRLELEQATATEKYSKFTAEPFERGFGTTIGNSLRRVLLSSVEGVAVTSLKIDGAMHEFTTIEGVLEDIPEILLNLKKLVMRSTGKGPKTVTIEVEKAGPITGADIMLDESIEVINPELHIATLTKDMRFYAELEISRGRGYVPAERNKKEDQPIGVIALDASFSPVTQVNYYVEETRVGQMTDYDKLIVEVWTNGAVSPEDAMLYASNILARHLDVFTNFGEILDEETVEEEENSEMDDMLKKPITELELSVRSANCLTSANIRTLGDLVGRSEAQMLKYKNFGKKSLGEIQGILVSMGLGLGMDLDAPIQEKVTAGQEEQAGSEE